MSRYATPRELTPEAHCVLGTMLRPFSLGHHLLFARIGSPFEGKPDADASPEDLALAVFICAAPHSQTQESIIRGEWEAEHRRWTQQLKPRFWQRTRFIHEREAANFAAYLTDGYRRAPIWRHGGSGITPSAPWECLLQSRLMAGGWSQREVLEGYLPALWYHYQTLREIQQLDNYDPKTCHWRKVFWTEKDATLYARAGTSAETN